MAERDATVLVVEDDAAAAVAVSRVLERDGFKVRRAGTLREARELLVERRYAATLLDLKLPDGSSIALLQTPRLRTRMGRAVLLSGHLTVAITWAAATRWRVDHVLSKPAMNADLLAAVRGDAATRDPTALELGPHRRTIARLEREYIDRVLVEYGGNISQTARVLGLHRQSLQRKLRKTL